MSFTDTQVRALRRAVPAGQVRTRVSNGKELDYVEGWYLIDVANRIFGFDGWDRETVETRQVLSRESRGTWHAVYVAKVRVAVRAGDRLTVREGHGTGEGRGALPGEAHDLALKAAETDATKRALATFGKAFGLALYAHGRGRRDLSTNVPADHLDSRTAAPEATVPNAPEDRFVATTVAESATESPSGSKAGDEALDEQSGRDTSQGRAPGIDKSGLPIGAPRRIRDKEHLRYVAAQPCLLCSATPADAHHLRFTQPRALGRKVSDEFTVPLCRAHHRQLHHSGNEAAWWHDMGIDPVEIAADLWRESR